MGTAVNVAVAVGVLVDVDVGVGVLVDVAVGVGVLVDVAVGVGVLVDVAVGVGVLVDVAVGVGVGGKLGPQPTESWPLTSSTTRWRPMFVGASLSSGRSSYLNPTPTSSEQEV